jgi:hypothetical protein
MLRAISRRERNLLPITMCMMSSEEHGKMSNTTETGNLPGVYIMKNGLESMATAIQVEMAGKKSTLKDPVQATGDWSPPLGMARSTHNVNVQTWQGGRQDERLDESRSSNRCPLLKRA